MGYLGYPEVLLRWQIQETKHRPLHQDYVSEGRGKRRGELRRGRTENFFFNFRSASVSIRRWVANGINMGLSK